MFAKLSPQQKKWAIVVVAVIAIAAIVATSVDLMQGAPLGFREDFAPLPKDNTIHFVAMQNPKNKKYFLRMVVQNPEQFSALMIVNDTKTASTEGGTAVGAFKSVNVVASGRVYSGAESVGEPFTRKLTLKSSFPSSLMISTQREYVVPYQALALPIGGAFLEFLAVDQEVAFPAGSTSRQIRNGFYDLTSRTQLYIHTLNVWPYAGVANEKTFEGSLDLVAPW